ncbi:MFS general substrate transporter [Aspergillus sclerotioniger CBS 115572]|uniref:MFS general substrate transporter n=1 Tax=Aspergillus sclerotioniger CBS 115572 TaxID=1450535 RepID=A0A317X7I1_9EURO|nr:MFS general substrate transporter [Aspergillus sclerotioniger CBS 115572]PWY94563.1 MFS general substrate transporter [Aspergillus sclerotioniger CBS 115572]
MPASNDVPSFPNESTSKPTGTTTLIVNLDESKSTVPLWKHIWQHSLTQMLLMSIQAFCGPAMGDAIGGLGGGGLATPHISNIASAVGYTCIAVTCFLGGPITNKLGTKWALVVGAMSFPIRGSSYYCNSKFGNQWYLILGGALGSIGAGCWYVAEAGTILTLAPSGARGKYLALWIVSRNMGQLVGGTINLAENHIKSTDHGVTPDTYIPFIIIECLAFPFAFLIAPLEKVIRSDGTKPIMAKPLSTKDELKTLFNTITSKLVLLSALWAIWSFFYGGSWSTYLALYFSVRARALSSLISPFFCIIGCFCLGFILDTRYISQRRRAQIGLVIVVLLNIGVYIWSIVKQVQFNRHNPGRIDWDDHQYPSSFLPYFFSYMYWLIASFGRSAQENVRNGAAFRCIEAVGQAIAYGMNTQTQGNPLVGFCVTFGLLGAAVLPMVVLVNRTPENSLHGEHAQSGLEQGGDVGKGQGVVSVTGGVGARR